MFEALLHGLILGFGLILPLGAQNVFVFNQGVSQRTFIRTVPVILTASICDTILILLAVLGVSLIVLTFAWLELALYTIGFFFLVYIGWTLWKSKPNEMNHEIERFSAKKQILFALSVSLLNPHAILDTIGVIGTNSLNYADNERWIFTLSTILVSWLWFFGLALVGRLIGKKNQGGKLIVKLNKLSACIIWGVAIYMALQLI
ncbi:LysE/ArgO family amino acid transporter [Lederbergia citrea]|uniref:Amino acid transporter n=1 Tax=Lederbergia citrea TaxID=2833581 RepID=A0A942URZ9_9BACI|nr:LysE/ArgO family amino acid transporter [Lederbergia citrea]MBS4223908.1 amino acid transporter [Lederbergia citrea]